jgi:hypothetical protein
VTPVAFQAIAHPKVSFLGSTTRPEGGNGHLFIWLQRGAYDRIRVQASSGKKDCSAACVAPLR